MPIRELKGHEDAVDCVAISGDGKFLASGSGDESVKVCAHVCSREGT